MSETVKSCPFCERMRFINELSAYYSKPGYTEKFSAALVSETYYGDKCTGTATYCNFELNYCPTCGRFLKPDEKQKI